MADVPLCDMKQRPDTSVYSCTVFRRKATAFRRFVGKRVFPDRKLSIWDKKYVLGSYAVCHLPRYQKTRVKKAPILEVTG